MNRARATTHQTQARTHSETPTVIQATQIITASQERATQQLSTLKAAGGSKDELPSLQAALGELEELFRKARE